MVLTTTQSVEQQAFANTTTISFSLQNLENKLQNWQRSIEFLKQEHLFFMEMLELSIQSIKGDKRNELITFQQKMMDFEKADVALFTQQLQTRMTDLIVNNESRGAVELEESHENLESQWQEVDAIFKGLKLVAFEKITANVPVKIY